MILSAISGMLLRLDVFGHKIGVHYKGEEAYKTKIGGLLTLITYTLILIQTTNLFTDFLDNSAQTEQFSRIKQDLVGLDALKLTENQLEIAFIDRFKGSYPPEIGRWEARMLTI